MRIGILALAAVAVFATNALAGINAWWQLDGSNCAAFAAQQGEGQQLQIIAPPEAPNGQYYEFALSMYIATDAADPGQGCRTHRNNLWRGTDDQLEMAGDPWAGLLNPLAWTGSAGYLAGSQNDGDHLIENYGRGNRPDTEVPISASNSPQSMLTLTLRINASALGRADREIWQSVGYALYSWYPLIPMSANQVIFGDNPPVYGYTSVETFAAASDTERPVITVGVPEPATLLLLLLGGVAVMNRPGRKA